MSTPELSRPRCLVKIGVASESRVGAKCAYGPSGRPTETPSPTPRWVNTLQRNREPTKLDSRKQLLRHRTESLGRPTPLTSDSVVEGEAFRVSSTTVPL